MEECSGVWIDHTRLRDIRGISEGLTYLAVTEALMRAYGGPR